MAGASTLDHVTWPTSLRERRPSDDDQARFRDHGFVELPGLWTVAMSDALAQESARVHADAVVPLHNPAEGLSACCRTRSGHTSAGRIATGSVLLELHRSLLGYAQALAGQPLTATGAAYRYFPDDDGLPLHADVDAAEVVLLATVLGEVGPLSVRPELRGRTAADLASIEHHPSWNPFAGHLVHPAPLGVIALRGSAVPHHRVARPVPTLAAVAALHYRTPYEREATR